MALYSRSPAPERSAAEPEGLADVFDELSHNVSRDSERKGVRLGALLAAVGRSSYGPLLLIVGLFSISPATILPGMTSVAAIITLLIAVQMAVGMPRPWLPRAVLKLKAPRRAMLAFLDKARPRVERIDGVWLRPRLEFLTEAPFVNLVALCVVASALVTIPLSFIPFGPVAPGLAVVLFGLGMTARDGLWLLLGVAFTAGAFFLAAPLVMQAIA